MATAKTAWRCSQCGAVNEPGSRACAQCGKWPSLFDLQDSVEEPVFKEPVFNEPVFEELGDDEFEVETHLPESFEPETFEPDTVQPQSDDDPGPAQPRWRSILSGVIVPVGLLLYFLITLLSDR